MSEKNEHGGIAFGLSKCQYIGTSQISNNTGEIKKPRVWDRQSVLMDFTKTAHPHLPDSSLYQGIFSSSPWRWLSDCSKAFASSSFSPLGCVFISKVFSGRQESVYCVTPRRSMGKRKETQIKGEGGEKGRKERTRKEERKRMKKWMKYGGGQEVRDEGK